MRGREASKLLDEGERLFSQAANESPGKRLVYLLDAYGIAYAVQETGKRPKGELWDRAHGLLVKTSNALGELCPRRNPSTRRIAPPTKRDRSTTVKKNPAPDRMRDLRKLTRV